MTGRDADLLESGVRDAHSRPAVDQQQLAFHRRQSRRTFGQNRVEKWPHAELLRTVAFQRHFGDAAFDHLKTNPAVDDVLRWHDRAAQVKPGRAVEVADGCGDRREVDLGDFFPKIRLIGPCQLSMRDRRSTGQRNAVEVEQRFRIRRGILPGHLRHRQGRPNWLGRSGLRCVEAFFCLPRIEAGWLGFCRN
jgi:hypothetical protein